MNAGSFIIDDWERRWKAAKEFVVHVRGVLSRAAANGISADRIQRLERDLKFAEIDAGMCEANLANAR
jgi:hypothetical protein